MPRDKELTALKRIANAHKLGVRLGQQQQFVTERDKEALYRGYIEVDLRFSELVWQPRAKRGHLNNRVARSLAHELGHFLIAPEGRRYRKDYGIPTSDKRSAATERKWDLDEFKAQIVENYLLHRCGFGKRFRLPKNKLWSHLRHPRYRDLAREAVKWWNSIGQTMIEKELK